MTAPPSPHHPPLIQPMACATVLLGMLADQGLGQHRDLLLQLVRLQIAATGQPAGVLTITLREVADAMGWNNNAAARRRVRQAIDAGHLRMAGAHRSYQIMRLDLAFVGVYLSRSIDTHAHAQSIDAHANGTPAHPHRPPRTRLTDTHAHADDTPAHANSTNAHANSTPAHAPRPVGGVGGGSAPQNDDDDEGKRLSHNIIIITKRHGFDDTVDVRSVCGLPHVTEAAIEAVCDHARRHPGARNWRGLALSILSSPAQTESILHPEPLKFEPPHDPVAAAAAELARREQG